MNVRNDTKMTVDFLYYGNSPKISEISKMYVPFQNRNIFLSFHMNKNKGMDGTY